MAGRDLAKVTTDATGGFIYLLPAGPSALVQFEFPGNDQLDPAVADVQTLVKAVATLKATTRHLTRTAQTFRLTGTLAGHPLPAHGKTLRIQVRKGKSWHTLKRIRTNPRGSYTTTLKIRRRNHAKRLTIRTLIPRDRTYPYQRGTSPTHLLRIRAHR